MPARGRGLPLAWLAGLLLGWIAFDNILLAGFLGFDLALTLIVAVLAAVGIAVLIARTAETSDRNVIGWKTIAVCVAVACALLVLGGEGRWLFANADWQIRDAVLGDMGRTRWPYGYAIDGTVQVLRAPLGMYLKPALIGGSNQFARDFALLASNAFMLGGILALGSALFESMRSRLVALGIFFVFSGLDVVGSVLAIISGTAVSLDHLELWIDTSQFSSHATMLFWVPQHAMAGWLCAILFLLWQRGQLALGPFAAAIPLAALWSPLAIMGAVPFAVLAGLQTLRAREVRVSDIALGLLGIAIAALALVYLKTDASGVASRITSLTPMQYVMVILLEVLPFSALAIWHRHLIGFGSATPIVAALCLVLMPIYCIGEAIDFQMRASIVPLAILALAIATLFDRLNVVGDAVRRWLVVLLMLGAITPLMEVRRAFAMQPAPVSDCTLPEAWDAQTGNIVTKASYLARLDAFPVWLRPKNPAIIASRNRETCWNRLWATPRF